MEMVRSDLEQASRTVDTSVTNATTDATMAFPTNTIANPSTANLTPITSSDLTTPMRLNVNDVVAAQAELANQSTSPDTNTPVSRSRKPNWVEQTADTSSTDTPVGAPPADTSNPAADTAPISAGAEIDPPTRPLLANSGVVPAAGVVIPTATEQPSSNEITALQQEIRQLKSASPSISSDSFMLMKVEVEQLSRDLKKLREELSSQKPTNSVSYDDMMMMRVQIGQLSHQIDQLNRQLTATKSDVEPSA
jgi:hypothetical protein